MGGHPIMYQVSTSSRELSRIMFPVVGYVGMFSTNSGLRTGGLPLVLADKKMRTITTLNLANIFILGIIISFIFIV